MLIKRIRKFFGYHTSTALLNSLPRITCLNFCYQQKSQAGFPFNTLNPRARITFLRVQSDNTGSLPHLPSFSLKSERFTGTYYRFPQRDCIAKRTLSSSTELRAVNGTALVQKSHFNLHIKYESALQHSDSKKAVLSSGSVGRGS